MLVRSSSVKTIFEIGTLHGYSALLFALNSQPDALVYTLDLLPEVEPMLETTIVDDSHVSAHVAFQDYLYLKVPAGAKVTQLYGDSAKFDFRPTMGK